jgi:MEMO1 family protein
MPDDYQIAAGYVLPHPPVIVPGVNRGPHKAEQTVRAIRKLAGDFARLQPETVVVISPHAPMFSDFLFMYDQADLEGSLARFGAAQARISQRCDQELLGELNRLLEQTGIPGGGLTPSQMRTHQIDASLDHGVVVPLYFLAEAYSGFRLLAMSCSNLPMADLYRVGGLIRQAAARLNRKTVVVASGDQSHKVNDESPYGSCPEGAQYDNLVVDCLKQGNLVSLLGIEGALRQKAAECGYRSMVILSGAYGRQAVTSDVLSYEAPYGIGYCVAAIQPDPERQEPVPDSWEEALARGRNDRSAKRQAVSAPVRIAQTSLEAFVRERRRVSSRDFASLADADFLFQQRAGAFVSLKKFGELRGCIGTTAATTACLAAEIIQNALSAGLHDPRFEPIREDELSDLAYSVDILGEPEPVSGPGELDPAVFGVIVQSGARSGLLLPDLEGVDQVDEQLAIACRKAGIRPSESYQIKRFRVTRYH